MSCTDEVFGKYTAICPYAPDLSRRGARQPRTPSAENFDLRKHVRKIVLKP